MVRPFVVFAVLSALTFVQAPAQDSSSQLEPALSGYITRSVSRSDFDVNGLRVVTTSKTRFMQGTTTNVYGTRTDGGEVFFGERVNLYGKINNKKRSIEATEVIFCKFEPHTFSGIAVVDRIVRADKPGELILRADGYPILINKATRIAYSTPLSSLTDIKPNIWITYHGTRSTDGMLVADSVGFQTNDISKSEGKLIDKNTYDPAAVPSDSKQGAVDKFFLGLNPKKLPPYPDTAMQERVTRIGTSLIPVYQRNLAADNPSKINFQFQVIDYNKLHDALTMPSGIILVPRQVVERLENDSQIATVLADNIACALEKQSYRLIPAAKTMGATQIAGTVGGFFVPGLGLATSLATGAASKSIQTDLRDQSGRVSLGLMHDAGYDIQQAPVAWWRLATKPSKPLANTTPPPRAINLYQTIGLIWKNYPDTSTSAGSPATPTSTPTNISQK